MLELIELSDMCYGIFVGIMLEWIIRNKKQLSMRGLEKAIGCPESTIRKAVKSKIKLPIKWERALHDHIRENFIDSFPDKI